MKLKKILFLFFLLVFSLTACNVDKNHIENTPPVIEKPTPEIPNNPQQPNTPDNPDTPENTDKIDVSKVEGYNEGLFLELNKTKNTDLSEYKISYKKADSLEYIYVDKQLIRETNDIIRCDILGLSKGLYSIKIDLKDLTYKINDVYVSSFDRSGFAHFNTTSSVGGYNNDGSIKNNATIVYVNENNKNSVTATIAGKQYTGLVNILQAQSKSNNPLIIRILGTIGAATWYEIDYKKDSLSPEEVYGLNNQYLSLENHDEESIISKGYNKLNTEQYPKLNNLSNRIKYSSEEFDSYYNMCDISNAKNVTVEGVGCDAKIYQWGFTWKNCSFIEVRNLTFEDYPEDACSFEGSDISSTTIDGFKTGNIWFHNNTVLEGKNYWDVCNEQDKHDGDGSIDLKGNKNITISYNHFISTHKTGLVGGSDSTKTTNITFHHNYYEKCGSRLPLGRQANMHMYNNYYYASSGTNMSIRAGAYAFIENCVFENCNNPIQTKTGDNKIGAVKSYNNSFINCYNTNNSTVVTNRCDFVSNENIYNQTFDTDSSAFYFDDMLKISKVEIMNSLDEVKEYVMKTSGVLKGEFFDNPDTSIPDDNNKPNDNPPTDLPIVNSSIITFNQFELGSISSITSLNNLSIVPYSSKTTDIKSTEFIINDTIINKYVEFGGGGNFEKLCVKFTTTKTANITVYYGVNSNNRYVSLYNSSTLLESSNVSTTSDNNIVSYTFKNVSAQELAVCSKGSRIGIYAIVIEYLE